MPAGDALAVPVRLEALHFFDARGSRIDVGWRGARATWFDLLGVVAPRPA